MTNTMSYYHYTQGTYQAYSAFVYMDSYGQTQTSQRCYTTYTAYSAPSWPPPGGYIPPTCNYSIQAAFKTPYSGQWAQNLTVAAGTQVQVGAFRNSDYNSFPGDMTIHLTGPGVDMYPANNSSFTPTQPGSYVLQVSYSNCTAVQAFLTVGGGGNSCNYSIQAAFKNTSFGGQWLQNLTTTVNTPIQIGAFRNSDYNNFYNDMTIYLTGPGVTNTNPANGSTFTPTQAGTYTLQVSYAGCAAVQAYLTVSGGGGYFPVLNVNKKVIYNGVEYDNLDATVHKFAVGEMINYKIYYQNVGATAAYNVVLVDRPAVYLSPTNYGSACWDGALLTFNLGSLGISGSGSVQYTAQVRSNLPAGDTTQTNVAQIRADNMTTMVSDTASVVVGAGVVQGTPALQITKTPSNQTVSFGGTANFSIQVVNISSVNVNNISIIDSLPSGFYFTGGSTSGATTNNPSISGNQLTWSNFTLTPGSSLIINFRATAPNYPGSFTNSARALFDGGSAGPVIVGVSVQQEVIINTYVPATTVQTPVINPIVLTTFVPVSSGQVLGVTTLPKTGSEALFLGGLPFLGGLGYKLREYRSRKKGENFIDIFSQRQRDRQGPSILG